ncbi:Serine/threonine-protein kinase Nek1 [Tetrabaena socialis]|uniref:non-specific serine/threonine protein kinase n=1 Tax=Tetrabaena socialis TaxID=47790 RepID=A0A2J7ZQY0_9CHLO|nr:Serine/threonine-protein kinase Nek1 [Tetrabaena socialis]|eukprot:PNH02674.1 Serine/threonine-protein kinase Nek1 [Tetrabaena socialis]
MEKYVVSKKLGTGTYGSAYIVSLRANPAQQYVLKKVKVEGGDVSADGEVRVLRALSHPLVLAYVDHFMYKGHLCIVTEYCDAGDLYQLLRARKSAMPEHQLLDLFAQVLLAIQHVHSKSILHRDLKTQNIFLTSSGSIRLGDFGISRPLNGTMDLASTIIGTPYYMSPAAAGGGLRRPECPPSSGRSGTDGRDGCWDVRLHPQRPCADLPAPAICSQFAAAGVVGNEVAAHTRSLHTSLTTCLAGAPAESKASAL